MSDGLTAPATPPTHDLIESRPGRQPRSTWVVAPLQALMIVVAFAVVGTACGWLWFHVWDAPTGTVASGQWFTNEAGLRAQFAGLAWYVTIALPAGLVLGLLAAWLLDRSELVTLAAVLVGSALAAYLMLRVGTHLSPGDPHHLAKTAQDGTKLKGALRVSSWPPKAAFPFGALAGLAFVFFMFGRESDLEPPGRPSVEPPAEPSVQPRAEFGEEGSTAGTRG